VNLIVVPILTGKSRAKVIRILRDDGLSWIEKHGGGLLTQGRIWALALRSVRDDLGQDAEELLWTDVPSDCADKELLRRFRLLDELF